MLSVILALASGAQGPLRLADVQREAREHNPELLEALAQVRAAQAAVSPAAALDDPMLMVQLWNAPADFATVPLMIQISQNVPLGNKLGLRREVAAADARGAAGSAAAKARDLEAEVAKTFFDLFVEDRTTDVLREVEETLHAVLRSASVRVEAGKGEVVDQLKAEAELLKTEAELETNQARRAASRATLLVLLDRDPAGELCKTTNPAILAGTAL